MAGKKDKKIKAAVEKAADDAKGAVGDMTKNVAKAVDEVKPVVEKATDGAKEAVKATRKRAVKATEKVKNAAARAVGGEATPVVYVQYQGEEEKVEDLVAAAKAAFAAEHGLTKVTDLKLYIKPEERAAYYVVNERFAGRVDF